MKEVDLKYKAYSNFWVVLFFLFLPFNYALTFSLGFPLKISELTLFACLISGFLLFGYQYFSLPKSQLVWFILAFTLVVTCSVLVNIFWTYNYPFKKFPARLNYRFDSILKYLYFVIDILVLFISYKAFKANREKVITWWFYGSVIAAIYSIYLFSFSLLKIPVYLLPGMDNPPQMLRFGLNNVIRCGTFKEGNYMGVYLLICFIVAKFSKRKKLATFFFLSIFTTFSSIAIVSSTFFLVVTFFRKNLTARKLPKLLFFIVFFMFFAALLLSNKHVRFFTINKLTAKTEKVTHTSYSKTDRLNSMKVSLKLVKDNPIFGVGLGNYGLHYDHYNKHSSFEYYNFRPIANNVYLEILAETGLLGFLSFLGFIILLYRYTIYDRSRVLRTGLVALLICFIAFPTFSVIFIWVYFGLILSLKSSHFQHIRESNNSTLSH